MIRGDREHSEASALRLAHERIATLEAELSRARSRDSVVTALPGVQAFRAQVALEVQRSRRYRRPLTVLVLDIDGFRRVNLEGGMARGDALLRDVAALIADETRVNDQICRLGGDEFAVLLPETPIDGALEVVRRILIGMERLEAPAAWTHSASIGVAGLTSDQAPESLLAAAREALEQARERGGGRFALYAPAGEREATTIAAHGDVIAALASALVERDRYTSEHSESVVELAETVARSLGLDSEAVANIRTAALLHDIGKVGVPDEILRKQGPLDEGEWVVMRQHPVIGERILRAIPGMGGIARMVRHEHERWDGGGYPDGLVGEDIPLGSRIVLACDAYHAMISDRPYRAAMGQPDAISDLAANAGTQFDPDVVEVLVGVLYGRAQSGVRAG